MSLLSLSLRERAYYRQLQFIWLHSTYWQRSPNRDSCQQTIGSIFFFFNLSKLLLMNAFSDGYFVSSTWQWFWQIAHNTFCPTIRSVIVLVNSNKSHSCLQWWNFESRFCNPLNWTFYGPIIINDSCWSNLCSAGFLVSVPGYTVCG